MKMDRNVNDDGLGKYALINLRRLNELCGNPGIFQRWTPGVEQALKTLDELGVLEWGSKGEQDEFFVVKLKDINSPGAIAGYANEADKTDNEWADEVRSMLPRAGANSPYCKRPD
jgi:hypothetical protein